MDNNHFHELICNIKPDHLFFEKLMISKKFDLGDQKSVYERSEISHKEFNNPPYPITLVQLREITTKNIHFFLIEQVEKHEYLKIVCFTKYEIGGWADHDCTLVLAKNDTSLFSYSFYKDFDLNNQLCGIKDFTDISNPYVWILNAAMMIIEGFEVINCTNVICIENKPPKFINKKREKKNKIPIFSYWTLHIKKDAIGNDKKSNGTHASPRLHLRRGHIRKLKDGRKVWVIDCLVGDKTLGLVNKDYAVH